MIFWYPNDTKMIPNDTKMIHVRTGDGRCHDICMKVVMEGERSSGRNRQKVNMSSFQGALDLCWRSCIAAGESGIKEPRAYTVFSITCLLGPQMLWTDVLKSRLRKFSARADENRLILPLPGQWIGTGYDPIKAFFFSILRNPFPSLKGKLWKSAWKWEPRPLFNIMDLKVWVAENVPEHSTFNKYLLNSTY